MSYKSGIMQKVKNNISLERLNVNSMLSQNSNSGASLTIEEQVDGFSVIKNYRTDQVRNLESILKQKEFSNLEKLVAVPIKEIIQSDQEIKIKMPYIKGLVGSKYALYGTCTVKNLLIEVLNGYFAGLNKRSVKTRLPHGLVVSKLRDVFDAIEKNTLLSAKSVAVSKQIIDELSFELSQTEFFYPKSKCHGDLTLSNVIINTDDNRAYLIDFLSVFLESYLLDYVKIRQDLRYGWSSRFEADPVKLRFSIFGKNIEEHLFEPPQEFRSLICILEKLNIVRIAPYIRDNETINWYEDCIERWV